MALAADHGDGDVVKMDPTTDITDLYAWMSSDGAKVYLVMDVYPAATTSSKFSNTAKYVFHLASSAGLTMPTPVDISNIICTFSDGTAKTAACWVQDAKAGATKDYVAGDASATAGLVSTSGKVKLFAGLRDDPFFFNAAGFKAATGAVHMLAGAGALMFDSNGCPKVDMATSMTAVSLLKSDGMGGAGKDSFAGQNVLSIVLAVDKTLVTSSGNALLSVWASTNK